MQDKHENKFIFCIILQSEKGGRELLVNQLDGSLLDVMDLQQWRKEDLHDMQYLITLNVFCCVWGDNIACRFTDLPIPGSKCSH